MMQTMLVVRIMIVKSILVMHYDGFIQKTLPMMMMMMMMMKIINSSSSSSIVI